MGLSTRVLPGLLLVAAMGWSASVFAVDSDGDNIDDDWELRFGMNPNDPSDAVLDTDGDGLSALEEFQNNTKPWDRDSDNDWIRDGIEVNVFGTDPADPDTDDDQIFDAYELLYGFDPLNELSGPGDPDGDGFDTVVESRLGGNPTITASVPGYQGNFSTSFEQKRLPTYWYFKPAGSDAEWRWNCTDALASNGNCAYQADRLTSAAGESRLGVQLYVQPGTFSFKVALSTLGKFQVWVDGIRVYERVGWGIYTDPVELYFPEGQHEVEFVHVNEGAGGGLVVIDEVEYREVTSIYGADASNRFCADAQRFLANTDVTTYTKIEPDFPAFLSSKVEPWFEQPPYAGDDSPLTLHALITRDPTDSYEQLISCKVKHYEGLNVTVQAGLGSAPQRDCSELNQQTLANVLANLTPAELAQIPTDGNGAPVYPVIDADQGSFASEWVYDTAYTGGDGLTHIQAKRLKLQYSAPPGFEPPPERRGVHYCHLIAPEYMKVLVLGGTPIDNAPAGRD